MMGMTVSHLYLIVSGALKAPLLDVVLVVKMIVEVVKKVVNSSL